MTQRQGKGGTSGGRRGSAPRQASDPPLPSPPSQGTSPSVPSLIPEAVYAAAQRLEQGGLKGEVIESRYAADDPYVLPFLKAVAKGDEARALTTLANILRVNPRLLEHPYVFRQFRHLFTVWSALEPDITDRADEQLIKLIEAWAQGMTLGYEVSITRPGPGKGGMSPTLLPHLFEKEGWIESSRAIDEQRGAATLVLLYLSLMERLHHACRWRVLSRASREPENATREGFLHVLEEEQAAEGVRETFVHFKRDLGFSDQAALLPVPTVREILFRSFSVEQQDRKSVV